MSRFPLEIYFLIIEAICLSRRQVRDSSEHYSDDFSISTLKACSLVCRAWYHYAAPFFWVSASLFVHVPDWKSGSRLSVGRE